MRADTPAYDLDIRTDEKRIRAALADAAQTPFWLEDPGRPTPQSSLIGTLDTDLLIVGGGYCGLWTALQAKEADPGRDVVLVEGSEIGWAASGRNGGFVDDSLTHGRQNGQRYFAEDLDVLETLAQENFAGFRDSLTRHDIDAEWEEEGSLEVATERHQLAELREMPGRFYDREELAGLVRSPLYRAGVLKESGAALVHPAKLAWGLKAACLRLGVRIFEHTPVTKLTDRGRTVRATTGMGTIRARQVVLATNGFPSLLRRNRFLTIPIYDYVLMTEPLTPAQLDAIGWHGRFGIGDASRQFHYYRKTADNRILWGGYDAVYHRGGGIRPEFDQRPETFARLADHFLRTFPQLGDIKFSHAWGGMIDMSTQLAAFQGLAMGDKVAYAGGFTGLGVAATRFAGTVMLELLAGADTPRTRLRMATKRPLPIPPEPIAYPAVQVIRRAIARADRNGGRDGLILKTANLLGFSFDS
ncbi:glycine/D-amino acid oxidase-like deaminating enzyme [Actinoplanes octamycinicus]|uniref:Glycine/D-amino acid oxidase-like deaminating enzyme n=1 Tax=Actinoplanes octamycinicus TaxID=135948 RepID=A0A7W7MB78_9ACTN|nr:FAD-dependent oxidoreductase [Actinoplanes octamycinicus]MBB4743854.1 glycine/D-amino acid oxidase-like deaminating enzyme [Actinoplanes octamycinicus]GIE58483.1 oxidoreductase [Actinoplanes octamycinicus]